MKVKSSRPSITESIAFPVVAILVTLASLGAIFVATTFNRKNHANTYGNEN